MEKEISKEEIESIKNLKGEARGITIKGKAEFIIKKREETTLQELEETTRKLGYPVKYTELRSNNFYPVGYEAITLLIGSKVFGMNEKEIMEMGSFVSKLSAIVRLFMKYLFSIELMAREAPRMWRKYYTIGDLKVVDIDGAKKYAILALENYRLHPLYCPFFKGYFASTVQMSVKTDTTCEEQKCTFQGDNCHEFLIKWK